MAFLLDQGKLFREVLCLKHRFHVKTVAYCTGILRNPPNSLDLALCDFWLTTNSKNFFECNDDSTRLIKAEKKTIVIIKKERF